MFDLESTGSDAHSPPTAFSFLTAPPVVPGVCDDAGSCVATLRKLRIRADHSISIRTQLRTADEQHGSTTPRVYYSPESRVKTVHTEGCGEWNARAIFICVLSGKHTRPGRRTFAIGFVPRCGRPTCLLLAPPLRSIHKTIDFCDMRRSVAVNCCRSCSC